MAKLSSYYTLCPLIDQQNLLGVQKDSDSGCAIVTLGRNIVIRYKLQDLKQISSWSSKERLTTSVIYDKTAHRYAAVFNERKVKVWSVEESDLNNVKGYKFQFPFHTILVHDDLPPVLVQQNGATASLEWALQNRKSWCNKGILNFEEKLLDCQLIYLNGKASLCGLTRIDQTYNYIIVELDNDNCVQLDHIKRTELKRTSEELVAHVVMQNKCNAYLLTLWSHGRLYSHSLMDASDSEPSKLLSVITNIDTKYPVIMTALNETMIAAYGADVSEEGAILMIYNVQFKLVQATQKLKLYTKEAKLWRVEDKLLLAANRHLAVAPYRLAPQRIAAMLGSSVRFKNNNENEEDEVVIVQDSIIAQWENTQPKLSKFLENDIPQNISKQILSYISEGLSDARIQEVLIPQLIESKDIIAINWCLNTFKDLSEKLLTDLLAFSLRTSDDIFIPLQNGMSNGMSDQKTLCTRSNFLDKIFSISYSDVFLLSYLKTGLNFNEVLRLLNYLIEKLDIQETVNNALDTFEPNNKQLYDWSNLLLDSHYQHYILSQDSQVLTLLNKLSLILEEHFQLLKDLENLRPMLQRIINGKSLKPSVKNYNKFYSIEEIKFY
ncbi:nucleolar protein 11-like isoform X1 [Vespa mandarinia]|uniref:nucleolar protein 11-like isoform X1 n=1 Tax=Vespa mandarinia TaxID=7446 RepID=UPI001612DA57|nr:nucleolar protein 11-like isoform X1 [Vespa mandarinia]